MAVSAQPLERSRYHGRAISWSCDGHGGQKRIYITVSLSLLVLGTCWNTRRASDILQQSDVPYAAAVSLGSLELWRLQRNLVLGDVKPADLMHCEAKLGPSTVPPMLPPSVVQLLGNEQQSHIRLCTALDPRRALPEGAFQIGC